MDPDTSSRGDLPEPAGREAGRQFRTQEAPVQEHQQAPVPGGADHPSGRPGRPGRRPGTGRRRPRRSRTSGRSSGAPAPAPGRRGAGPGPPPRSRSGPPPGRSMPSARDPPWTASTATPPPTAQGRPAVSATWAAVARRGCTSSSKVRQLQVGPGLVQQVEAGEEHQVVARPLGQHPLQEPGDARGLPGPGPVQGWRSGAPPAPCGDRGGNGDGTSAAALASSSQTQQAPVVLEGLEGWPRTAPPRPGAPGARPGGAEASAQVICSRPGGTQVTELRIAGKVSGLRLDTLWGFKGGLERAGRAEGPPCLAKVAQHRAEPGPLVVQFGERVARAQFVAVAAGPGQQLADAPLLPVEGLGVPAPAAGGGRPGPAGRPGSASPGRVKRRRRVGLGGTPLRLRSSSSQAVSRGRGEPLGGPARQVVGLGPPARSAGRRPPGRRRTGPGWRWGRRRSCSRRSPRRPAGPRPGPVRTGTAGAGQPRRPPRPGRRSPGRARASRAPQVFRRS